MKDSWTPEEETKLALWAEEQKKAYREGTLEKEKILKLESIPRWRWD